MIQVKAGRTWSVWQLAQVDLGATYCARVTFEGADYESTIAGNVWSPGTATITATTNEAFTASCVVTVA